MHFLQGGKNRVIRVGLLDGVVWFVDAGLYASVRHLEKPVMTALLLNDFLQSLL